MKTYIEQLVLSLDIKQDTLQMLGIVDNVCVYTFYFITNKSYIIENKEDTNKLYNGCMEYVKTYEWAQQVELNDFKLILESVLNIYNSNKTFEMYLQEDTMVNNIYNILKQMKVYRYLLPPIEKYYSDNNIAEQIINNINNKNKYNNVINLFSGFGNLLNKLLNNKLNYNKIYCYDDNDITNSICELNISLPNNDCNNSVKTIVSNIINTNNIDVKGDLILCDITKCNIKNIIYANCNEHIKKLKIRGTKMEPLILQLLLQIVNKDGEVILVTPNSLLFGESNQHIETRKYLLENFNIHKIIELESKNSIIFISNNKNNDDIELIKNDILYKVSKNTINNTTYSLYFNNIIAQPETNKLNKIKLSEYVSIISKSDYIIQNNLSTNVQNNSNPVLYNSKFNTFSVGQINNDTNFNYVFLTKEENILKQEFINIYLLELFTKKLESIVKGKMQKVSIDLMNDIDISVYSIDTQEQIILYINLNNTTISNNIIQINNYHTLKHQFIENMLYNCNKVKLSDVFNVSNVCLGNSKLIIKKNSLNAGTISIINNHNEYIDNTNYYYLDLKNVSYNYDYFYYILHFLQYELVEQSTKNKSIGLSKNVLENMEIPILPLSEQNHLIYVAKHFMEQIECLEKNNKVLEQQTLIKLL